LAFQSQPQVADVYYPGLASHPQHVRATEMFGGRYGALISFELKDSNATFKVLDALRVVTLSTHLSVSTAARISLKSSGLKLRRGRTSPSIYWWQTAAKRHAPSRPPAAEGGGQRPAFTGHGVSPNLSTGTDATPHPRSDNFKLVALDEIPAAGDIRTTAR
jgi:Cys/Met metabolism PLP-dependent enzyme